MSEITGKIAKYTDDVSLSRYLFCSIIAVCKKSEFKCEEQGGCIDKIGVCNGQTDCVDGSDEKYCRKYVI